MNHGDSNSKHTTYTHMSDDLATPQKPIKIVAAIPAFGRIPLLRRTIERLYQKNGVHRVIVAGSEPEVEKLCIGTGAVFVRHHNNPLGAKWNAAFRAAMFYDPDGVLFVGSSDWLSDNWLPTTAPLLEYFDMIGKPDCYFLDIGPTDNRLCYWPGYTRPDRKGESIGIGRLLSRRILDRINWSPFDPQKDNSLDHSMQNKVMAAGGNIKLLEDDRIKAVSISTHQWPNKHRFEQHWNNELPSTRIPEVAEFTEKHFPEANTIFQ